jgi:signal transduction histidine kinase
MTLGADAAFATAVREVLVAQLPDVAAESLEPAQLKSRPVTDGIVIDARGDSGRERAAELARRLRAMGFAGAIVTLVDVAEPLDSNSDTMGVALVAAGSLARDLVPSLAERLENAGSEHAVQAMRARRLVAAGEVALRFQHALNNPLAGILAEAQLLQMESLPREHHEALERIVGLCRRIVELGKSLDGMGERK